MLLTGRSDSGALSLRRYGETSPEWTPPSCHQGLELAWVKSGALTYQLGRRQVVVPPGSVVVVPEGADHRALMSGGGVAEALHLGPEQLRGLIDELGPRAVARGLEPGVVHAGGLLDRIERWVQWPLRQASALAADSVVVELLRRRLQSEELATVRDVRIARALELLWSDLQRPVGVDELAIAAGMSRFHFSRQFKVRTGKSPHRFLLEARLGHAAHLLRTSARSVTEAATTAGFSDLSRFSQQFRRHFGVSPRAF